MSMTRGELQAELWGDLQEQFQEAGIINEDSSGNLKGPLDRTLMALGVAWSDRATGEIADGDEDAALSIATYFGLDRAYRAALNKVDITIDAPNTSVKYSQLAANLKIARDAAKAEAAPFMETAPSAWAVGSLSLGHITTCTEDYA